jgi:phosphoadenosine phosphosulfate reductase
MQMALNKSADPTALFDETSAFLREAIGRHGKERIALVSSFGADAAILLHMIAGICPDLPILFINTGKLFGETLSYRDRLIKHLGLTGLRTIGPNAQAQAKSDPEGDLWLKSPDQCCAFRKVQPLAEALAPYDAWINGRKRFQSLTRSSLEPIEQADGKTKYNPLVHWSPADISAYFALHDLEPHPLVADGYPSIGCMPCSDRVSEGEDSRAGRWRGQDKVECGIHLGAPPTIRDE